MKDEERRMEEIMEQERALAAKKLEKTTETERLKKKQQAVEIEKQIKENEMAREMELARMAEVGASHRGCVGIIFIIINYVLGEKKKK